MPRDVLVYIFRWRSTAPELLMLRRTPERGGFWHWVSGAPERGESDLEGAIREVREETGLDVAGTIFALGYRYEYRLNPRRAARWLELYGPGVTRIPVETFAAEAPPMWEPEVDRSEHDDYVWCTFEEAEGRLFWPGEAETLGDLTATLAMLRGRLLPQGPSRGGETVSDPEQRSAMAVRFVATSSASPPATDLLAALRDDYEAAAGRTLMGGPSAEPSDFTPPSGTFLLAYEHGQAIACGGLKTVGPGVAEVKRMYVVPEARRRGVGRGC